MSRTVILFFGLLLSLAVASNAGSDRKPDLICHTSNPEDCYPRVFVPTNEFQIIRDDQEIPPGLHVRLDIQTGEKEAKINDPTEDDAAFEAVEVVPGEGPVNVPLESEAESKEALADGIIGQDFPLADGSAGSYGPIKPPMTYSEDAPVFNAAVAALTKEKLPSNITGYMEQLRDLTDDMYWGLQLASNMDAVQVLAGLIGAHELDAERGALAARVLASAVRNNAPALSTLMQFNWPHYHPVLEYRWLGTVYEAVLEALKLKTPEDFTASHISEAVEPKAYERYISLLSTLLSSTASRRAASIPEVIHLAGTQHFSAPVGVPKEWEGAQKRLLTLVLDHYVTSTNGGQDKVVPESARLYNEHCELLRAWRVACEVVETGEINGDVREAIKEAKESLGSVIGKKWESGGCGGDTTATKKIPKNLKDEL